MRLCLDATKASVSGSQLLVAPVWLDFGEFAFPSVGWTDFVSRVLEQWSMELNSIRYGDGVARLCMFDGPAVVRIERHERDINCYFHGREYKFPVSILGDFWHQAESMITSFSSRADKLCSEEESRRLRMTAGVFGSGDWASA